MLPASVMKHVMKDMSYNISTIYFIYIFIVHSQPLSIETVELVDDTNSQFENKPVWRSPNEPR